MPPSNTANILLRLEGGDSVRRSMVLEEGRPLAPFAVGTQAAWTVRADRVESAHILIAYNGTSLFACALPGKQAHLDGALLGARWTEVNVPGHLRFGGARIGIRRLVENETPGASHTVTRVAEAQEMSGADDAVTRIGNAPSGAAVHDAITCFVDEEVQIALRAGPHEAVTAFGDEQLQVALRNGAHNAVTTFGDERLEAALRHSAADSDPTMIGDGVIPLAARRTEQVNQTIVPPPRPNPARACASNALAIAQGSPARHGGEAVRTTATRLLDGYVADAPAPVALARKISEREVRIPAPAPIPKPLRRISESELRIDRAGVVAELAQKVSERELRAANATVVPEAARTMTPSDPHVAPPAIVVEPARKPSDGELRADRGHLSAPPSMPPTLPSDELMPRAPMSGPPPTMAAAFIPPPHLATSLSAIAAPMFPGHGAREARAAEVPAPSTPFNARMTQRFRVFKRGVEQASPVKKATAILLIPALFAAIWTTRSDVEIATPLAAAQGASARGQIEATPDATPRTVQASSKAQVPDPSTTTPSVAMPSSSVVAGTLAAPKASAATSSIAPVARPGGSGSVTPTSRDARTAERKALDAAASGLDADAAAQYDALASANPENMAFREAARILRARSAQHD